MTQVKAARSGHQRSASSVLSSKAAQVYRGNLERMPTSNLARSTVKEAKADTAQNRHKRHWAPGALAFRRRDPPRHVRTRHLVVQLALTGSA